MADEHLKLLKLLQRHFEEATRQFPGLTFVSEIRPKKSQEPQVPKEYLRNSQNIVKFWEHNGIDKKGNLVIARRCWLIRPKGETWNKDSAYRRLRKLAEEGISILRFIDYLKEERIQKMSPHDIEIMKMYSQSEPIFLEGEEEYNHMKYAAEWILRLHQQVRNNVFWSSYELPTKFRYDSCSWIEDVFYESTLYCQHMMHTMEDCMKDLGETPKETKQEKKIVKQKKQKKRPTAAEMDNRNRSVAMAATDIKMKYDRLPTVSEISKKTKLTHDQIYATKPYKEGEIAKRSAKLATDMTGGCIASSELFKDKSIEHSRANRRTTSEQIELEALIDQQEIDDSSDSAP
ncbi:MAG: hypothetical protein JXA82_08700 [Sedimentisphaerales bacterium]|nr:hypothetical protein [Sedimentisphaerales bacterium]